MIEVDGMCSRGFWFTIGALLLLFLSACCSPKIVINNPPGIPQGQVGHGVVMIHVDFNDDDMRLIREGIDLWVNASRGLYTVEYQQLTWANIEAAQAVQLSSGRCQDLVVFELATSMDAHIREVDRAKNQKTRGLAQYMPCGISRTWLVVDRLGDEHIFRMVASHEFGHTIGLNHIDSHGAVMYRSIMSWTKTCITREDAAEFCDKFLCDPADLAYCYVDAENVQWNMPPMTLYGSL